MVRFQLFNMLIFCLLIASLTSAGEKDIYIIRKGDILFGPGWEKKSGSYRQLRIELAQQGYQVQQATSLYEVPQNFAYIICDDIPTELKLLLQYPQRYPKHKLIVVLWEPPSVVPYNYTITYHRPFSKIITWHDDLVDNQRYLKFYYPRLQKMIVPIIPFEQKKLCTLMANNKNSDHSNELYSYRRNIIEFFEKRGTHDFDFYGRIGWNKKHYKNYKGSVANKIECLKQYRFCICYENIKNINGYISEKILDCFAAGCVPVYWGAKNIEEYIPKTCFIAREDFNSNQELYQFLKRITKEDYQSYIDNIKNYLDYDPRAQLFSLENFTATIKYALLGN